MSNDTVTIELTQRQRAYLEEHFAYGNDEDANSGSDAFGILQRARNAMGEPKYVPKVGDAIQHQYGDQGWVPGHDDAYRRIVIAVDNDGQRITTRDTDDDQLQDFEPVDGWLFRLDEREL